MLRVAFAGTPPFARAILDRLIEQGFAVGLVMSQPDRPSGRGMKLLASPVKTLAAAAGIEILQPRGLRLDGKFAADAALAQAALERAAIDVLVVAAYGLILPPWLLALPRHGCLNVHASLLPRWRGAAPIQRAIEAGDALSGITIMQMDAGLDTGAVIDSRSIPIGADETAASLQDRLAGLGAERIVAALRVLAGQALAATPQPADGVSYAAKISKAEAAIDWGQPAAVIERRLRAFDPAPGARGELDGQVLTLWRGRVEGGEGRPGEVFVGDGGTLSVACGEQRLAILELQRAGGRRLPAAEFLRGWRPPPGASFAAASEAARQLEHQRGR